MKKPLLYGAVVIGLIIGIFAWWWYQPSKVIGRIILLEVPFSSETLFSKSENAETIYLLKVEGTYVKKIIDGCELHGGSFAAADQTSAARLANDAAFKAHGLLTSNRIGCYIKGKEGWEYFVKDSLLYFRYNH